MSSLIENQNNISAWEEKIRVLESQLQVGGISEAKEIAIHTRIAGAEQVLAGLIAERRDLRLEQQTPAGRNINVHATQVLAASYPITFEDLLRKKIPDFIPNVVYRGRRRFSGQMLLAIAQRDVDSAVQVYEQTLALPQTTTEMQLQLEGYLLNGPWQPGNDNLIICYKGTVPLLLKTLTPKESVRSEALINCLRESERTNHYLTSFELRSHKEKMFMIMPFFASTIESIPVLSRENGVRLFNQMRSALDFLHEHNFNHMDIKPANICVRENGDFVLIDLGSAVRMSEYSESTSVYVPIDFQRRENPTNRYQATIFNDWLMLGMTIAEKVYGLEVGGRKDPPTIKELREILEVDKDYVDLLTKFPECGAS